MCTNECVDIITLVISIIDEVAHHIYLSNVFSPNGDEINDTYKVNSSVILNEYKLNIFDRWGGLVFSTSNIENSWDGTFNGHKAGVGMYVVLLSYQLLGNDQILYLNEPVVLTR